jgi:hypothetical protein
LKPLLDALKPIQRLQEQMKGIEAVIPKDQFKGLASTFSELQGSLTVG